VTGVGPPYDDAVFFERYQEMRQRRAGLNEDLEQPAITRMLPSVAGADVLDIGCGDGGLARWLVGHGARRVLGVDTSARMLALAAGRAHPRVRYCRVSAETLVLPPESQDLVVSSLALHYVAGYATLIRHVACWLRCGGYRRRPPLLIVSARKPEHGQGDAVGRSSGGPGGAGIDGSSQASSLPITSIQVVPKMRQGGCC
jgi:ubiquinone/menaquinone biosynthesis C-methylase UbiE